MGCCRPAGIVLHRLRHLGAGVRPPQLAASFPSPPSWGGRFDSAQFAIVFFALIVEGLSATGRYASPHAIDTAEFIKLARRL